MNFKIILNFLLLQCCLYSIDAQQYIAKAKPIGGADWGYIDEFGEFLLPPIYKYAYSFSECGLAAIYDNLTNEVYYINIEGDTILRSNAEYELIKPEGGFLTLPIVYENALPVIVDEKQGFINSKGDLFIAAQYDKVTFFNGGVAIVSKCDDFIIIDKSGFEIPIVIPNLESVECFSDSLALFKIEGGKEGFIGMDGNIEIKAKFLDASCFFNGIACVKDLNGLWGGINKAGDWVIAPKFESIIPFKENSEFTVARDAYSHKYVLLSRSGDITDFPNDARYFFGLSEEFVKATFRYEKEKGSKKEKGKKKKKKERKERDSKVGFINGQGEWVISPDFDGVLGFKNGFAAVRKDHMWGFVNKYGIQVIKPSFIMVDDMEKVDMENDLNTSDLNTSDLNISDIMGYIEILRGLHINWSFVDTKMRNINKSLFDRSASSNDSSSLVNKEYNRNLDNFYNQDMKFVNWILSFKNDTINFGLSQKIIRCIDPDMLEYQKEINDSELALIIVEMFLIGDDGEYNLRNKLSHEQIESFLNENKGEEISTIRTKWINRY